MKKIILLFVLATALISCSSDESNSAINPNLLQRVDFYPGTSSEKRWLFNSSGLLTDITKADGTSLEKFIYDSDNNVVKYTIYEDGSAIENYLISYDSNNKITDINGKHYNYSTLENRYYYTIGNESFSCYINNDGLATHYLDFFDYPNDSDDILTEFSFQYENGNLSRMSGFGNNLSDVEINFNYSNVVNPLKIATLPVLKIKSILEPNFFNSGISSNNTKEYQSFALGHPESHSYGILINQRNKIELLSQENYSNGVLESILTNSHYYYQGDVLP